MTGPKVNLTAADLPKWWRPDEPMDFYIAHWQKEEASRLEILAQAFANGKLNTATRVKRMAGKLRCSPRYILERRHAPAMVERVKKLMKVRAIYGAAEAMGPMITKAGTDVLAWQTILKVAGVLESGSGGRVNVAIDARKMGDTDSDRKFFESYHNRVLTTATVKADGEPQPQ